MSKLNHRSRTLLGAVIGAAVLVLPSTALADCASVVAKSAFRGAVVEYYPQACYSKALKSLGPDVNTYSPNVSRNLKSAMRRDRTRTLKFTLVWLAKNKVLVATNYKVKSSVQVRKGAKVLAKGSISSTGTRLKLKKTNGRLTVALIWTLGKGKATVAKVAPPGAVVKNLKLTLQRLAGQKVRIRSNFDLTSAVQVRKGAKIQSRGVINGKTTTLTLKKTTGTLTVALIWTVGKSKFTVTKPVPAA